MPVGTQTIVDQSAVAIKTGTKTLSGTAAQQLTATSTPCKRVKLISPVSSSGAALNVNHVFFGDATRQDDWIAIDGSRDQFIHVPDASMIYVKGDNAAVINYRIEI